MDENVLMIYKYGSKVLRKNSKLVTEINEELVEFVEKMAKTMYEIDNGIGLAAPQVGRNIRLMIIDLGKGLNVFINPEIIEKSAVTDIEEEGCLSLPEINAPVERPTAIKVKYYNIQGEEKIEEYDDFMSRAIQHEIDHLDGVLFIDRVNDASLIPLSGKLKEIKKIGKTQK